MINEKITFMVEKKENLFQVEKHLRLLRFENKWQVTIEPYKKNRSLKQNRLLMLWMKIISDYRMDHYGEYLEPKGLKEWFKELFLGETACGFQGKISIFTRETSALKVNEFTEFLEKIEIYSAEELEIVLPRPDDMYWESMGIKRRA